MEEVVYLTKEEHEEVHRGIAEILKSGKLPNVEAEDRVKRPVSKVYPNFPHLTEGHIIKKVYGE